MHREELKHSDRRLLNNESLLERKHISTFSEWLERKVKFGSTSGMSTTMKWLACRPSRDVMSYSGYIINGNRFHTRDVDRSTQDSGVSLEANTLCRSSAKDTSQAIGKVTYYGVINDIILLDYHMFKVPIFDCDWANITNGVKAEGGFTLVNLHQGLHQFKNDPFILASQAKKVFYWRVCDESNWYAVLDAPVRGFYDFDNSDESACTLSIPLDVTRLDMHLGDNSYHFHDFEDTN